MKSLVLFNYKQPVDGSKFRWGVLQSRLNTNKHQLSWETIKGAYRNYDPEVERQRWGIKIPFVGSLISPFLPA